MNRLTTDKNYWKDCFERRGKITGEDTIVCPYCFAERELLYDHFEYGDEFQDEEYCEECGETFKVEGEVRHEFWATTKRKDDKNV